VDLGECDALWARSGATDQPRRLVQRVISLQNRILATSTALPHGAQYLRSLKTTEVGRVQARLVDVMQKGEGGQWIRKRRER
jgi:hypothetical protein